MILVIADLLWQMVRVMTGGSPARLRRSTIWTMTNGAGIPPHDGSRLVATPNQLDVAGWQLLRVLQFASKVGFVAWRQEEIVFEAGGGSDFREQGGAGGELHRIGVVAWRQWRWQGSLQSRCIM